VVLAEGANRMLCFEHIFYATSRKTYVSSKVCHTPKLFKNTGPHTHFTVCLLRSGYSFLPPAQFTVLRQHCGTHFNLQSPPWRPCLLWLAPASIRGSRSNPGSRRYAHIKTLFSPQAVLSGNYPALCPPSHIKAGVRPGRREQCLS